MMSEIPRHEEEPSPEGKIEEFSDQYAEQVKNLVFEVYENELGHHSKSGRPDMQNIPEFYQKDETSNFWVATNKSGEIIGTIGLTNCGDKNGYLQRMIVKKEMRRHGVASRLLNTAIDFARESNYERIFLSTWPDNIAAQKFYQRNGFKEIDSIPENIEHSGSDTTFFKLELNDTRITD